MSAINTATTSTTTQPLKKTGKNQKGGEARIKKPLSIARIHFARTLLALFIGASPKDVAGGMFPARPPRGYRGGCGRVEKTGGGVWGS